MAESAKNNFKLEKSVRLEARMCSKANTRRLLMKTVAVSSYGHSLLCHYMILRFIAFRRRVVAQ